MVVVPPPARRLVGDDTERWTPWTNDRWESLGHLHLYRLAQSFARGRRVLVLGSGEGFGAAMLAEVAEHVFAVEPDVELLLHSRYNYRRPNLVISHGEPQQVMRHAEEGSFDLVAAFDFSSAADVAEQVIEWTPNLLRPEGAFLVSVSCGNDRTRHGASATRLGHLAKPTSDDHAATNGNGRTARRADPAVTSEQVQGLLRERFPQLAQWRQSVGSRFASSNGEDAGGAGNEFLAKEKDVFIASFAPVASLLANYGAEADTSSTGDDLLDWVNPLGDRESAPSDLPGVPPASVELGEALAIDETRLRRQVVAYDAAIGRAIADSREARRETEGALAELEITEIELWAARRDLENTRQDTEALAAQLAEARAEAEMLRQRLEAIEGSRTYRAVRSIAAMRPTFPNHR